MEGLSTRQFYGTPVPHRCQKSSIRLIADIVQEAIFKSLQFPAREKPTKCIVVKILSVGRRVLEHICLDELLCHGSSYDPLWKEPLTRGIKMLWMRMK